MWRQHRSAALKAAASQLSASSNACGDAKRLSMTCTCQGHAGRRSKHTWWQLSLHDRCHANECGCPELVCTLPLPGLHCQWTSVASPVTQTAAGQPAADMPMQWPALIWYAPGHRTNQTKHACNQVQLEAHLHTCKHRAVATCGLSSPPCESSSPLTASLHICAASSKLQVMLLVCACPLACTK